MWEFFLKYYKVPIHVTNNLPFVSLIISLGSPRIFKRLNSSIKDKNSFYLFERMGSPVHNLVGTFPFLQKDPLAFHSFELFAFSVILLLKTSPGTHKLYHFWSSSPNRIGLISSALVSSVIKLSYIFLITLSKKVVTIGTQAWCPMSGHFFLCQRLELR